MRPNKRIRKTTTNNKEYKAASGNYEYVFTDLIDRKSFRNWKLYRKSQRRDNK
jgi:hypothetical protein